MILVFASFDVMVTIVLCRRVRVHQVFQKEPFLAANTTDAVMITQGEDSQVDPSLLDALNNCKRLRSELSLDST